MVTRQGRVRVDPAEDPDVGPLAQLPQRQCARSDGMRAEEHAVQAEGSKVHPEMVAVLEHRPRLCPQPGPIPALSALTAGT